MKTPRHPYAYALSSLLAATILALIPASAHAASITWGAATNITADTDVSTTGSLVGAFNIGDTNVSSTTLNGVNFQGFAVPDGSTGATSGNFAMSSSDLFQSSNGQSSLSPPFSALSAQYQTLLAAVTIDSNSAGFTLTISGLTLGTQYIFQWWTTFTGVTGVNNLTTATAGNSVTLQSNTTSSDGGVGQFAIGTFTADATTQSITFSGSAHSILNGFQLRQVPEASSLVLVLLGSCVWVLTARRRG